MFLIMFYVFILAYADDIIYFDKMQMVDGRE